MGNWSGEEEKEDDDEAGEERKEKNEMSSKEGKNWSMKVWKVKKSSETRALNRLRAIEL